MTKKIDANTRFYIDMDIRTMKIIGRDYGSRYELGQESTNPDQRRIFFTKGQYHKVAK